MKKKMLGTLVFGALAGASQPSLAALTGADSVTINFPSAIMTSSSYGYGANLNPQAGGLCPDTGGAACYVQNFSANTYGISEDTSFVIGSPFDGNGTNHIHRVASIVGGGISDKSLAYHGDSSGIYLRALDQSAFNLASMVFNAAIGDSNYIYGLANDMNSPLSDQPSDIGLLGPQEKWEIFGFSSAINSDIATNDGYATAVAHASIANGFVGTVGTDVASDFVLGEAFKNVSAIWIHYNGYPSTPSDSIIFDLKVDNITLAAPTAVPVPAAVWMFGSGLLGMLSFGRRKVA